MVCAYGHHYAPNHVYEASRCRKSVLKERAREGNAEGNINQDAYFHTENIMRVFITKTESKTYSQSDTQTEASGK